MTGQEMVNGALELIGVLSPADGDASAADSATALAHANRMRKSWNIQNLALHAIERATFTWPAAASSRTIGPAGADLTGTRPLEVLAAKVIPSGQTSEVPIDVLSHLQYAAIADKTQTGDYPLRLLYEPTGAAIGTLKVWPVPTTSPTLVLHNKALLGAIVLETAFAVPEAYEAVLVSQLAKRLAPIFGKSWTGELEDIARADWAAVKVANIRVPDVPAISGMPGTRRGVRHSDLESGII